MFLLFDKVYVKYDYLMDNNVDNMVITPNLNSIFLEDLKTAWRDLKAQMHNLDDLEELWTGDDAPYDNDKDFFTALKNKGTVNIHVNRDNYDKIIIKFIKLLFETLHVDIAWKIYNTFSLNSQLENTTTFLWGANDGLEKQKNNAKGITYLSKSEFITKWNAITLDLSWADYSVLRSEIIPNIGVEFLIANYLASGSDHNGSLGKKMLKLLGKKCNEEVQFLKSHLFYNIYKSWVQGVLGISDVNAEDDLIALKDTNDRTRWLFDDEGKYHRVDYVNRHPNIRFSTIRSEMMQAVTQNSQTPFEENLSDTIMDAVYDSLSLGYIDTAGIGSIMAEELKPLSTSAFECEDRLKVNVLFLNYIYKLKNANSGELNNFRL